MGIKRKIGEGDHLIRHRICISIVQHPLLCRVRFRDISRRTLGTHMHSFESSCLIAEDANAEYTKESR